MMIRIAAALTLLLAASSVRAEDCPSDMPDDSNVRRSLAKKWFAKGESEGRAGNDVAALKSYQCSLKFVPHGFTAYNIAQIAERVGDLEAAIASYEQYLLLVPDAQDAKQISEKLDSLKERLAKVRQSDGGAVERAAAPPIDKLMEKANDEPVVSKPSKPAVSETPASESDDSLRARRHSQSNYRTLGWISLGGGGALLAGGVVTNLLARNSMSKCRSEFNQGEEHLAAAESACSSAKSMAYLSYGLFGLGAAAAVTGVVLLFVQPGQSEQDVALVDILPEGGLSLRWQGRF